MILDTAIYYDIFYNEVIDYVINNVLLFTKTC